MHPKSIAAIYTHSDHIFAKLQLFYLMIGHKGRQLPKSVSSNTGPALGFTTFGIFMITVLKSNDTFNLCKADKIFSLNLLQFCIGFYTKKSPFYKRIFNPQTYTQV